MVSRSFSQAQKLVVVTYEKQNVFVGFERIAAELRFLNSGRRAGAERIVMRLC